MPSLGTERGLREIRREGAWEGDQLEEWRREELSRCASICGVVCVPFDTFLRETSGMKRRLHVEPTPVDVIEGGQ